MERLFVYGTLRNRYSENPPAVLHGAVIRDYRGCFPYIRLGGDSHVVGEVIDVTDEKLSSFDRYEGYDESSPQTSFYVRTRTVVTFPDGSTEECWIYVGGQEFDDDENSVVESGDWFSYVDSTNKQFGFCCE
jgi:gamma-glutamylcyclotransferase (GGCT)/AIG2-like uncharacterized protein YtfP